MGLPSFFLGSILAASPLVNAATRQFYIQAAWGTGAPDGYERNMILVNGTSPGPALVVDQGDDVEFYVQNDLDRVTTVHFHGIEMLDTPWSDGVPGLSQKPIPAGGNWLYKWKATQYGAYWYHAHYQAQVSDGFFGPLYIRPRKDLERPFATIDGDQAAISSAEKQPQFVMISDWQHVTADELLDISNSTNIDVYCTQSVLINGQGRVNCLTPQQQMAALAPPFQALYANGPLAGQQLTASGCAPFNGFTQRLGPINPAGLPDTITGCSPTESDLHDFKVDPTKQFASLHLMNAASIHSPVVSIDEHDMWVYAIDGRYIEPYKVQSVQISNGDRYSIFVPLTKSSGTYTLRANNFGFNQLIGGFASITYQSGSADAPPVDGGDGHSGHNGPQSGGDHTDGNPPGYGDQPDENHGISDRDDGLQQGPNPNGGKPLDCGIPGYKWNKPYGKMPDDKPKKVSDWQPPHRDTEWDWHGDLPTPEDIYNGTASPVYEQPENDGPATSTTANSEPTAIPYPQHPNNDTVACPSRKPKRATSSSYDKRADQFRRRPRKRQEAPAASQPWITYGGFPVSQDVIQLNQTLVVPFPNIPPPQKVSATHIFSMSRTTAPWLWKVGGDSYPTHPTEYAEDAPLLYFPESENAQNDDLVIATTNGTWVDLIFTVPDTFGPPHPMHKHSNKAYVIGRGVGPFPWRNVAEAAAAQPQSFNFVNPPMRDGYATAPSAGAPVWLAIRYHVINPGAFMLHCHIQTHLTGGMAVVLLDGPGEFPTPPEEYSVDGNGQL